ncbi:MAG: hypothetical protein ACM3Y9_03180 [Ignavibacteria bacterium]
MRRILAALAVFSVSAGAHAQGMTDIFRSVTNALQGGRQQAPQEQGPTPVIGVRGMDQAEDVAAAPAAGDDYTLMEGWSATPPEAEALARKKGLAKRPVTLGKAEAPKPDAAAQ